MQSGKQALNFKFLEIEARSHYIYQVNGSEDEIKEFDNKVSGEKVLARFELYLSELKEEHSFSNGLKH